MAESLSSMPKTAFKASSLGLAVCATLPLRGIFRKSDTDVEVKTTSVPLRFLLNPDLK